MPDEIIKGTPELASRVQGDAGVEAAHGDLIATVESETGHPHLQSRCPDAKGVRKSESEACPHTKHRNQSTKNNNRQRLCTCSSLQSCDGGIAIQ